MSLMDLFKACIHPHDIIMIWIEPIHTLFTFDEFVMACYKANIPFDALANSEVNNICVNGDSIQCEVDLDGKLQSYRTSFES